MLDDEKINGIIAKLVEVQHLLTVDVPFDLPDLDVEEWSSTPAGQALIRVQTVINMLTE